MTVLPKGLRITLALLPCFVGSAFAQAPSGPQPATAGEVMPLHVVTYVEVNPSARDEAAALLRALRENNRAAAGNERAAVVQSSDRPGQFVVISTWKDKSAWDAQLAASTIAAVRAKLAMLRSAPMDDRLHSALAVAPPLIPGSQGAVYAVTHVDVVPPRREDAEAALGRLAAAKRSANGNLYYQVLQQANRPNHFTVLEVWRSRSAFDANIMSDAQREFRDALSTMTGALYDERLYEYLE